MGERKDVNDFLKKDFWSYMYDGGIHPGQLTGASFDLTPSGHSNINSTEKSYIETMSKAERAQYLALTVLVAIKDCTNFEYHGKHRAILEAYYIENLNNLQSRMKVGMTEGEYKTAKKGVMHVIVPSYRHFSTLRNPKSYQKLPRNKPLFVQN